MKDLNIIHKPHVYLAKKKTNKKNSKKYVLSVAIPVCAAYIMSIEKEKYKANKSYLHNRHKDCDIYLVTIDQKDIDEKDGLKIKPIPPLQFIGATIEIKKAKKKVAVIVKENSTGQNGHTKDAIHVYDDASAPIFQ